MSAAQCSPKPHICHQVEANLAEARHVAAQHGRHVGRHVIADAQHAQLVRKQGAPLLQVHVATPAHGLDARRLRGALQHLAHGPQQLLAHAERRDLQAQRPVADGAEVEYII
jgi:hypothetical protein